MAKRKIPERAKDCVTLEDKIAFSQMVREKWEALRGDPWAGPEQFSALMDKYGDENCVWSRPDWADEWAREERAKRAIERMARNAK